VSDFGRERQVVDDRVGSSAHFRVVSGLEHLKLFGSHQTIGDLLSAGQAQLTVGDVELTDVSEVGQDLADCLSVLNTQVLVVELQDGEVGLQLKASVEVLLGARAKQVVDLDLGQVS